MCHVCLRYRPNVPLTSKEAMCTGQNAGGLEHLPGTRGPKVMGAVRDGLEN
jgi:hypothetical protein